MSDYIKREDALDELMPIVKSAHDRNRNVFSTAKKCFFAIKEVPSADVAPVRHGRWKDEFKEDAEAFVKHRYVCTVCGEWQTYGKTQYCPNCGAKMDEEAES